MDGTSITLLASFAVLGAGAFVGVLWQQRRSVAELRRQLAQAENAKRDLADQLRELALHLKARPPEPRVPTDDVAERKRALERALDAAGPAPNFGWLETVPEEQPNERYDFAATEPMVDVPIGRG
jgi:hypothetical protein